MESADMSDQWKELTDGYGQSKWVAEQMCVEARSRGLPVSILRPGNMSPSATTGQWNKADFIYMLLQVTRGTVARVSAGGHAALAARQKPSSF